jgi:ribose transport system substrate-binding protein
MFTKNQTNPFFQVVRSGAESAAKQMGVSLTHYIPTKHDSIPEQLSLIDDVIIKKPGAVVFTPDDYKAMAAGLQKLNAAGIPVVNVVDRVESGRLVSFVGASDYELGLVTGRHLLKALGGRGKVVILEGVKGSLVSADRVRGFGDAVKEVPQASLLASQPGNFQRLLGLQVMENLMQRHPQIDGVMAADAAMAIGAIEALEAANRKALVVGMNRNKEAVEAIKAGKMLASGDYDGFLFGCVATTAAVRELRGLPVPREVVFKAGVLDKSNVQVADVPSDKLACPKWEDAIKG